MKKAVVFYSLDGNTRIIADEIAKKFEAEVFELEEVKKRPEGMKVFMTAGFQAFFGVKTKLKDNYSQQMNGFDMIYIGTPIWAAKPVPAVNSFLAGIVPDGKRFFVFTVQAGPADGTPNKAAQKIAGRLKAKGAAEVEAASFKGADIGKSITGEQAKKLVDEVIEAS